MPIPSSNRVQSPVNTLGIDSRFSELIKEGVGKWKENMVDEVFSIEEVALLKSIYLSSLNNKDRLIWGPTNT